MKPCMANACTAARDPDSNLCRPHWLALPADIRREIVRATNAFRLKPERYRQRFRSAWVDAMVHIGRAAAIDPGFGVVAPGADRGGA